MARQYTPRIYYFHLQRRSILQVVLAVRAMLIWGEMDIFAAFGMKMYAKASEARNSNNMPKLYSCLKVYTYHIELQAPLCGVCRSPPLRVRTVNTFSYKYRLPTGCNNALISNIGCHLVDVCAVDSAVGGLNKMGVS